VALLRLEEKIRNKSAVIGIVGIGYVGLPLCHYCHSEPKGEEPPLRSGQVMEREHF
jgi:ABC-type phosphate/phosphonate transport system permease subunit